MSLCPTVHYSLPLYDRKAMEPFIKALEIIHFEAGTLNQEENEGCSLGLTSSKVTFLLFEQNFDYVSKTKVVSSEGVFFAIQGIPLTEVQLLTTFNPVD